MGVAVVAANALLLVALYGPDAGRGGPMFVAPPDAFPIMLIPILAFSASLFGLWCMWRVWRGSR